MKVKWKPIETAPANKMILVACEAGYVGRDWIFMCAEYTAGYHDRWDDEGHDALMDSGYVPKYWTELPNDPEE